MIVLVLQMGLPFRVEEGVVKECRDQVGEGEERMRRGQDAWEEEGEKEGEVGTLTTLPPLRLQQMALPQLLLYSGPTKIRSHHQ